ncbi:adenylate/guanylate cyclase domain-containing protein [Sneathiella sp.]|uniref:adenylate/guanylate cyclase domain-containing protein n=1 Tax=Sneathiella sp. TaxID=1964365 RepID=UPI0035614183
MKIIPFGIMWCAFSLMYVFIEYGLLGDATQYPSTNNPYDFHSALLVTPIAAFVVGSLLGAAEVMFMNKLFIHRPFWKKIVFKTMVYLLVIFVMLVGISLATSAASAASAARYGVTTFDPQVIASLGAFLGNFAFWSIVIYAGCTILVSLYVSETSDYLGGNVFGNFFTGKYHRPVEEERIFMFLDMKSSTTIAEKLGHSTYFLLLNQYYCDTTNAIIDTWGEVYQYAGDEIIVSWSIDRGLDHDNCIRCFFKLKQAFEKEASVYREKYGLVPEFKAGFHCGTVTTGEIRALKKELFFTGDVMNTAARVQSKCNELEVDLLLSEDLASKLSLGGSYALIAKGEFELRGKREKTGLFTLVEVAK